MHSESEQQPPVSGNRRACPLDGVEGSGSAHGCDSLNVSASPSCRDD